MTSGLARAVASMLNRMKLVGLLYSEEFHKAKLALLVRRCALSRLCAEGFLVSVVQ